MADLKLSKALTEGAREYGAALIEGCRAARLDPHRVLIDTADFASKIGSIEMVEFTCGWFAGVADALDTTADRVWDAAGLPSAAELGAGPVAKAPRAAKAKAAPVAPPPAPIAPPTPPPAPPVKAPPVAKAKPAPVAKVAPPPAPIAPPAPAPVTPIASATEPALPAKPVKVTKRAARAAAQPRLF